MIIGIGISVLKSKSKAPAPLPKQKSFVTGLFQKIKSLIQKIKLWKN